VCLLAVLCHRNLSSVIPSGVINDDLASSAVTVRLIYSFYTMRFNPAPIESSFMLRYVMFWGIFVWFLNNVSVFVVNEI